MNEDMPLLLRRPGQTWRRPQVRSYTDERALQELLLESPSLIPGVAVAAVSVSGPAFRLPPESIPEIGELCVQATDEISRCLGFQG
jgi:hypothetical protein